MSGEVLGQFARMIPRLRAEEELRGADVLAVGTGVAERKARNDWLRVQRKAADDAKPVRAETIEGHHAALSAIGFHVDYVEVPAA